MYSFFRTCKRQSIITIVQVKYSKENLEMPYVAGFFVKSENIYSSELDSTYQALISRNSLKEDSSQRAAVHRLQGLQTQLQTYTPSYGARAPKGVYVYGGVGTGKTMIMDLFYDSAPVRNKLRTHFNEFMLTVHSRMYASNVPPPPTERGGLREFVFGKTEYDPVRQLARKITEESLLICLDEFQVTDIAHAMILKRLFTELFRHGCVVVATSNRHPDDLYRNGEQREHFIPFIPVLKQYCDLVKIDSGVDYRARLASRKGEHTTYFARDTSAFENMLRNHLEREGCSLQSVVLDIDGRTVTFARGCGTTLDCDFMELCGRPLGASDYLVICERFRTLFVRNVPQLSVLGNPGQSRRFITLVDTVYDNKIRMVISADVPASELFVYDRDRMIPTGQTKYTGEEEMFAAKRCLSRILEMQFGIVRSKNNVFLQN